MVNKAFWKNIAENWSLDSDGIEVPDDMETEAEKARSISEEDLVLAGTISDDEIDEILADLGLDDF